MAPLYVISQLQISSRSLPSTQLSGVCKTTAAQSLLYSMYFAFSKFKLRIVSWNGYWRRWSLCSYTSTGILVLDYRIIGSFNSVMILQDVHVGNHEAIRILLPRGTCMLTSRFPNVEKPRLSISRHQVVSLMRWCDKIGLSSNPPRRCSERGPWEK